jgi:sulfate transport system substrate-binding protein
MPSWAFFVYKEYSMWAKALFGLGGIVVLVVAIWLAAGNSGRDSKSVEMLNVSYDPTRELWKELNSRFIPWYENETGITVDVNQSHGGSGTQARAVIDGLDADVVTLALWSDTDAIRKKGLIAAGWEDRLPNHSLPYYSTIVFVVRKGNPKGVRDWPDLIRPGLAVITPNPKTSGNGKLSFLAAWGTVIERGGTEQQARDYVTQLYQRVPVLDSGARGSTTTFSQKHIGDVHLTWENEAHLEVEESAGELELVYPPVSIRAEPHVAVVDANVDHKGTRAAAEAYLKFVYSQEGQEVIARHYYRPIDPDVAKKYADRFPEIKLFPLTSFVRDGDEAQEKFFAEGAIFDGIYQAGR